MVTGERELGGPASWKPHPHVKKLRTAAAIAVFVKDHGSLERSKWPLGPGCEVGMGAMLASLTHGLALVVGGLRDAPTVVSQPCRMGAQSGHQYLPVAPDWS